MLVPRIIAALMLACLGILLPTAAASVRVCLLEERLVIGAGSGDSECCSDCTRESQDRETCCFDLDALPDASAPQPSVELPPAVVSDIVCAVLLSLETEPVRGLSAHSWPIRGPDSPAAYRAVLGNWRL